MNFQLKYFFELYKDTYTLGHEVFKNRFKKKYPNINIDLTKLLKEIEDYQIKTYGQILWFARDNPFITKASKREATRKWNRKNKERYENEHRSTKKSSKKIS